MKKLVSILLCCVLIITAAACQKPEVPPDAAELLDLGEKFLLELDYEQALVQFLKVIEVEPMNARAYLAAAEVYLAMGDEDKAIVILQQGLEATQNEEIVAMLAGLLEPNDFLQIEETGSLVAPTNFKFDNEQLNFYWNSEYARDDDRYRYCIAIVDEAGNIIRMYDTTGYDKNESRYCEYLPFVFGGIWENEYTYEVGMGNGKTPTIGHYSYKIVLYVYEIGSQWERFNYTACSTELSINVNVEPAIAITKAEVYKRVNDDRTEESLYLYGNFNAESHDLLATYDENSAYRSGSGGPRSFYDYEGFSRYYHDNGSKYITDQDFSNVVVSGNNISFSMTMPQIPPIAWQRTDIDPEPRP